MRTLHIRPPPQPTSLNRSPKTFTRPRLLQLCKIWWKSLHGASGQVGEIWPKIFIYTAFKRLTYRSDSSPDLWWLKWRGCTQGCAFFAFRWYCCPFRGSNCPKTPILGAWMRVFQKTWQLLKGSYYQNYCNDHNQILQSDRDPPSALCRWSKYAPNKSKMAVGRHLEKSKNLNIFATNSPILTKFDIQMRLHRLDPNSQ